MKRGDVVLVVAKGDFGKPRPAVVVQNDLFRGLDSVTFCPLTGELRDDAEAVRVRIKRRKGTGLEKDSDVMVDKVSTVRAERVRETIGRLSDDEMAEVADALRLWLDLA